MIATSPVPTTTTAVERAARLLMALRDTFAATPARRPRAASTEHALPKTGTLTLPTRTGRRIECLQGCVWITLDGDPRDVVLQGGQALTFDRDARALVHALEPARVRVTTRANG